MKSQYSEYLRPITNFLYIRVWKNTSKYNRTVWKDLNELFSIEFRQICFQAIWISYKLKFVIFSIINEKKVIYEFKTILFESSFCEIKLGLIVLS